MMKKVLIGIATPILILGIVLNYRNYHNSCQHMLSSFMKRLPLINEQIDTRKRDLVIYLINAANTICRPCSDYDQIDRGEAKRVIFYVAKDFSDNDIENFRDAFSISNDCIIERVNDRWQQIYKRCSRSRYHSDNVRIDLSYSGKIAKVKKF